jgi:spoIIIJ-associated protein
VDKNYLEISARTVEEATDEALKQMGATVDEVEITVIKKGRSGILGLGTEEAVVGVQRMKPAAGHPTRVDTDQAATVATEIIEQMLEAMGIQAGVHLLPQTSDEEPLSFDIKGEDLGMLIGRRGQSLAAFQFMARLIVAHKLQSWIPLAIDVEGYKARRLEALQTLALRMAEQVKRTQRTLMMEPMPADERRIVHLTLANDEGVTTQSTGEGEERKVSISLRKK